MTAARSVNCYGQPINSIPAETTRIHGIDDAIVAKSPLFVDVWPRVNRFLGQAVVVGHTVGFDLAVLKRECDLAGLPWIRPRTLDTRLLAQIAAPELAGYSLEQLAAWLGIDVARRPPFSPRRRDNHCEGFPGAGAQVA